VTTAPQTPTGELLPLNNILESAVMLNWSAFGHATDGGMVQVEYHVGAENSIEYLKIWSASLRGYLSLVCDYAVAVHRPNGAGARFSNGFHSRDLGRFLDSIMMNQNLFAHGCRANCNVLIQVKPPSEEQIAMAKLRVAETLSLASPPPRAPRVPKAAPKSTSKSSEAHA
jgi:hypothetical protein